jgi:hypothetical protein
MISFFELCFRGFRTRETNDLSVLAPKTERKNSVYSAKYFSHKNKSVGNIGIKKLKKFSGKFTEANFSAPERPALSKRGMSQRLEGRRFGKGHGAWGWAPPSSQKIKKREPDIPSDPRFNLFKLENRNRLFLSRI